MSWGCYELSDFKFEAFNSALLTDSIMLAEGSLLLAEFLSSSLLCLLDRKIFFQTSTWDLFFNASEELEAYGKFCGFTKLNGLKLVAILDP